MEGHVPIIVLALGAAVLGGPEALRLLLTLAGQSPVVDIAICVFVLAMVTAQLLGVALLARFVRKPRAAARRGARRTPATDLFAKTTLTVSVGVAFVVTACLVAAPGGGLMSSVFDFATGNSLLAAGFDAFRLFRGFTNTFLVLGAAAAAVVTLLFARLFLRSRRIAAGAGDRVPVPATGAERFGKLREMVVFLVVGVACIALTGVIQYAYAPPVAAHKPNGGKRECSA